MFHLSLSGISDSLKSLIIGKIAEANLVHGADASGGDKHNWVVDAVHALIGPALGIGKSLIHAVVGIVHDELARQTPAVLQPVLDAATVAADAAIDAGAAKLTASPFAMAAALPPQQPPPSSPAPSASVTSSPAPQPTP